MFETSLGISRTQRSQRSRKLLPVAVAAHGVLIAGVVLASYWSVSDVPEPDSMVGVVFNAGGPPPPLGGGERPRTPARPAERQRPAVTPPVVQPPTTDIADAPPVIDAPANNGGDDSSVSFTGGEAGDGSLLGVPGGTGTIDSGGGDDSPVADGPIVIRAGVTPPQLLRKVVPRYSEAARRMRREGSVFLEAIIDKDGRVANVRVLRGLGFGLDEEAAQAVSQWTYEPARLGQRIIAVYLTVRVDFKLQ
jgi:TonB family protein